MWNIITSALGLVTGALSNYLEYKVRKTEAKREATIKQIEKSAEADAQTLNNHKDSWKDEYITLVVTLPWVLTFIIALAFPGYLPAITNAWEVINTIVPAWFSNLFTALSLAIVGARMFEKYLFRSR